MGEKYIYHIEHLTKTYGKKEVLKDITLYFYPGAKIGVIGSNGAGKSTLLRVMAGQDQEFMGEAWADQKATIGYVPQEPRLTPNKTVMENIEEAVAPIRELLRRQEEIGEEFAKEDADFDKLSAEMDKVQIFVRDLGTLDESRLTRKERTQKELIQTLLKIIVRENPGAKRG